MATANQRALSRVDDEDESVEQEELPPAHVLRIGDEEFACGDSLPWGTIVRYADNSLLSYHHILTKLVDPADQDRMWDAFEDLPQVEALAVIGELIASYSNRPTKRLSSSRGGSQRTSWLPSRRSSLRRHR
jgi:hypothetical protein